MDLRSNPYNPQPGVLPTVMVGRNEQLQYIRMALVRAAANNGGWHPLFVGAADMGKTDLLATAAEIAKEKGYPTVRLEGNAGYGIANDLLENLKVMLSGFNDNGAGGKVKLLLSRIRSLQVSAAGVGAGVGLAGETAPVVPFSSLIPDLGELMKQKNKVAVFIIDELDNVTKEDMQMILGTMHAINQRRLPIVVIGAGGPGLPALMTAAKGYAGNFFVNELKPLGPEDSAKLLAQTGSKSPVTYSEDAINYLVNECHGNPYLLQLHGFYAWNIAEQFPISLEVAQMAHASSLGKMQPNTLELQSALEFVVNAETPTPEMGGGIE